MSRPGVEVLTRDTAPPRSTPTTSDVAFIAGMTEKGSHTAPVLISSLDAYTREYGARVTYGYLYDWLETAFREGLSRAYVSRVVGPSPVYATLNIAGTGTAIVANAKSTGVWANGAAGGLSVQVIVGGSGGSYRILIVFLNGVEVERTPEYATVAEFVAWSANSNYIRFVAGGGTGPPTVAAAANLAGGTDDHANATDATWEAATNLFPVDLGPGQICQPGRTTVQAHTDLLEHAAARNRFAIIDAPDSAVKATVAAAPDAQDALSTARYGAMFAPWVNVAGLSAGTTRTVPPSAIVCGRIAATDALAGVNQPPAGAYGVSVTGLSVTATFSDADAQELGAPDASSLTRGAVNLLRVKNGDVTVLGFRTIAEKVANPKRWMASNERLEMQIKAEAGVIGDGFLFRQIDGSGMTIGEWRGALEGMLNRMYLLGELYADPADPRPETAYYVDTGDQVNTSTTVANGELHAVLSVRMSPFAELVQIEVVKVPITMSVA